jgi:hypothetical protein
MGERGVCPAVEDQTAPGVVPSIQPTAQAKMMRENRGAHLRAHRVRDTNTSDGYGT